MPKKKHEPIQIYRDEKREYRVTIVAKNGEPLFVTSEGYDRRGTAISALLRLRKILVAANLNALFEEGLK